jgi:hypothetical protein
MASKFNAFTITPDAVRRLVGDASLGSTVIVGNEFLFMISNTGMRTR